MGTRAQYESSRLASLWQVKVRGVRVSLEEVEVLACRAAGLPAGAFAVAFDQGTQDPRYPGEDYATVDGTAAVITSAPDRGRLVGFFVQNGNSESFDGSKLRLQLAEQMTRSQLPAVLVPVDGEFPLTTTGKVRQHFCFHLSPFLSSCTCEVFASQRLVAAALQLGLPRMILYSSPVVLRVHASPTTALVGRWTGELC